MLCTLQKTRRRRRRLINALPCDALQPTILHTLVAPCTLHVLKDIQKEHVANLAKKDPIQVMHHSTAAVLQWLYMTMDKAPKKCVK